VITELRKYRAITYFKIPRTNDRIERPGPQNNQVCRNKPEIGYLMSVCPADQGRRRSVNAKADIVKLVVAIKRLH